MSGYEITCANRDAHGQIVRIGGEGWSMSLNEAIARLVREQLRLNIFVDGRYCDVGVRGEGPGAYLALEPDGFPLSEMRDLQSC